MCYIAELLDSKIFLMRKFPDLRYSTDRLGFISSMIEPTCSLVPRLLALVGNCGFLGVILTSVSLRLLSCREKEQHYICFDGE